MLGYFTHLTVDNLWMDLIGRSANQAFVAEFPQDKATTWSRVKDDCYNLDHNPLWDCPDNTFARGVVNAPNPPSPFAFLLSGAVAHRRNELYRATLAPSQESVGADTNSLDFTVRRSLPQFTANRLLMASSTLRRPCQMPIHQVLAKVCGSGMKRFVPPAACG